MNASRRPLIFAALGGAVVVLLIAGGVFLLTRKGTPATQRVTIHGTVTSTKIVSNVSSSVGSSPLCIPTDVGSLQLTVESSTGRVIGTTTTSVGKTSSYHSSSGIIQLSGCKVVSTYTVSVPKAGFYQFSLEGQAQPKTIGYQALAAKHFVFDITVD